MKMEYVEARLDVLRTGVGAITDSDLELAKTTNGLRFEFNIHA